jgi:hypothetical protein
MSRIIEGAMFDSWNEFAEEYEPTVIPIVVQFL